MIHVHPDHLQLQVEVILASKGINGAPPIYTIRMRYPRPIHAEIMTHRDFSRNARSSRAVPVERMLKEIREIPFVPWHWGKNQKGMQASEECNEPVMIPDWDDIDFHGKPHLRKHSREEAWLAARDKAVDVATAMMEAGYHKQVVNRLLESFMWIDTLVTSTKWSNFLWLRDHEAAEPHLRDLARLVQQALDNAEMQELVEGQWHLPYVTAADREFVKDNGMTGTFNQYFLNMLSAARCARISYKPFDGNASYEAELARYDTLIKSDRVHASPVEHQAQVDRLDPDYPNTGKWEGEGFQGNLSPGWVQFRKLIPGENHV